MVAAGPRARQTIPPLIQEHFTLASGRERACTLPSPAGRGALLPSNVKWPGAAPDGTLRRPTGCA